VASFKTDRFQTSEAKVRLQDQTVVTCTQDDSVVFRLIGLRQNFFPTGIKKKRFKLSVAFVRVISCGFVDRLYRRQKPIHETTRNHTKTND